MNTQVTLRLSSSASDVETAAALLQDGKLVAFPTETVYGLGADARQGEAVAAVFAAKGRPRFNPLIVHVENARDAQQLVHWTDATEKLTAAFWPGPLTLVLPLADGHGLSKLVSAGLSSVALRVPAHPTARALLRASGCAIAAPSANPSGRISPTRAHHVIDGLDGRIDAVIDDGPCMVGVESTIISLLDRPRLLREGGLAREEIEQTLGHPLLSPQSETIVAPGQLASHYAPRAPVRLNRLSAEPGEVMLGFGEVTGDETLSDTGDLHEAAARLFDCLHRLDAAGKPIAVAPIPMHGLGAAINDRLRRAAAPRT